MTNLEILIGFETEINKINSVKKPSVDDSLFLINQAVYKFVKLRFNGDQVHHTGFEQTEKRRHDLIHLLIQCDLNVQGPVSHPSYDEWYCEYPSDFMFALDENVLICDLNGDHEMDTCTFECTRDSFMYRVNNSLTDFHYKFNKARPLRIRQGEGCLLLTDKRYIIKKYTLGYIRKPKEISLENPYYEYSDFEDSVIHEIIKIAAQMYLENQKDERYLTISNEISTQE